MNSMKLKQTITYSKDTKQVGLKHYIRNSFKRSLLLPQLQSSQNEIQFQSKLSSFNFKRKDLYQLLSLIFSKQSQSLSDRNLVRRIMLSIFDESMICVGGKHFVKNLRYANHSRKDNLCPEQNWFYFLIQGNVQIQAHNLKYDKTAGECFGHLEILAKSAITNIHFSSNSSYFKLSQADFYTYFADYFEGLYAAKMKILPHPIMDAFEPLTRYAMLDRLQHRTYETGEKIVVKQSSVTHVIFFSNQRNISNLENPHCYFSVYRCIGLKEFMLGEKCNEDTIYSIDNQVCLLISLESLKTMINDKTMNRLVALNRQASLFLRLAAVFAMGNKKVTQLPSLPTSKQLKFNYARKKRYTTELSDNSFTFVKNLNEDFRKEFNTKLSTLSKSQYLQTEEIKTTTSKY